MNRLSLYIKQAYIFYKEKPMSEPIGFLYVIKNNIKLFQIL